MRYGELPLYIGEYDMSIGRGVIRSTDGGECVAGA